MTKINDNGVLRDMTAEEQSAFDEELQSIEVFKNTIKQKDNKKASGKQKLLDLGLTEAEVKALIGV